MKAKPYYYKITFLLIVALFFSACSREITRREYSSGRYNGKIAYALAALSHQAYRLDYNRASGGSVPPVFFEELRPLLAIDRSIVFHDPVTDTAGFIAGNRSVLIVVFRGTDSVQNALSDLQATQDELTSLRGQGMGRVHSGFHQALDKVATRLSRSIEQLRDRDQPVLFTGHSLGGALATLAVARAVAPPDSVTGLYTYGAPRVGNRVFKENFDSRYAVISYRIRNYKDPVPDTPPELLDFTHVGQLVYYDESSRVRAGNGESELRCSLLQMHRCVSFHQMKRYQENAQRNIDKNPLRKGSCLWPF
ncbi:MAG: lipase family protein [Spirochaetales bacterium]|nr:lipase family protein [Spirochaetales bacterium]